MAKSCKIINLQVQIEDIKPSIWRRIAVDGDITLRMLHHILQAAFGWTDSHLHEFTIAGNSYQMLDNENVLEFLDPRRRTPIEGDRKAKLQRVVEPGKKFIYTYDYGDSWRHIIKVEAIEIQDEPLYCASIFDGKRAGPPEDVGGPPGYANFVDTITNHRDTDEAEDYLRWEGGEFDPEQFDRRTAKITPARMGWNGWGKK